ncbi:methyltransferase domain-containing protein [Brevibacillus humidisoli]|uniref:class I SAM-dependent methyltransferase n=1 Tax=Brevibacillus humidisoli TaxID=2895522 RepID=UPI001E5C82FE|nr:class I SAM-dependent methyltransferase [Brevibacillus humidisoli]UFJ42406.1 methyltransferase domain-containing protein [Brevibacillus humidisoli]
MNPLAAKEAWQTFFTEEYLQFSQAILTPERTKLEVQQLIDWLQLPQGARILDLGCGQGRIAVPLAQAGYTVTGYDGSGVLLKAAREYAAAAGTEVTFVEGDMRQLDFEGSFDAVINLGTAFGYLDDEREDAAILRRIWRALRSGGQFLQDTENREFRLLRLQPRTWEEMNGQPVWSHRQFNSVTGRWRERITWMGGGELRETVLDLRLYTATELVRLTEAAGLTVRAVYGGLDRSPLTVNSPRMVVWSQKQEERGVSS